MNSRGGNRVQGLSVNGSRFSPARLAALAACTLAVIAPGGPALADLPPPPVHADRPVPVTVQTLLPGTGPGLLFLDPQSPMIAYQHGPQILDNQGRLVWFHKVDDGSYATNFQVQTYRGQPVLTWWEGGADNTGVGSGVGYIADRNYRIIATVRGSEPLDLHEFRLTPQGTALVILYREKTADLTSVGGPADGRLMENGLEEIDVATGAIVHEWWSLDHVPITDTDMPVDQGYLDYFHMNSVTLDTDGNYLVSARHTNTVYKVDRRTGAIIWRLGGRKSDFQVGAGATFAWQHDVEVDGRNTYRIFDNEASRMEPDKESRVLWVKVDPRTRAATMVRELRHPDVMSTGVEGGSQHLADGNTVVSWGSASRVSEFTADGSLVFDATLPLGHSTYRAYRFVWDGRPLTEPTVTVADDAATVHAVWNGATGVARWRVLGGPSATGLKPLAVSAWNGLDTAIAAPTGAALSYVEVEALDNCNRVIGRSPVTPTGH
jgi:hypothetical protein